MTKANDPDDWSQSPEYRRRYFALKERACNTEERDEALKELRDMRIYEADYEFNPEVYRTDALIPKGGILKAIRDAS